jgi:hypothetical protein
MHSTCSDAAAAMPTRSIFDITGVAAAPGSTAEMCFTYTMSLHLSCTEVTQTVSIATYDR